jgi:hypothetical protein
MHVCTPHPHPYTPDRARMLGSKSPYAGQLCHQVEASSMLAQGAQCCAYARTALAQHKAQGAVSTKACHISLTKPEAQYELKLVI